MKDTATIPFDVDAVRAQFPILSRQVNGKPLVYLDSAASAQKPEAVITAMTDAMRGCYANVHRGLHTMANDTTDAFEAARKTVAAFLGAPSQRNIVFTRGTTEAINLVASGMEPEIGEGDEIVLSVMEHHSNIVPWHFLRERRGAVLKWVPVLADGSLDMQAYAQALSPRTKLVAMTHMSNVLGTKVDVKAVVEQAHGVGAKVLVDGSQAAVHLPDVNVAALGVDFYTITGHKLYGPTGIGALYGTNEALDALRPYHGGGEMIESVSQEAVTYNDIPYKFEAGTPAIIEAIGLGAALDWLQDQDRDAVLAHEETLRDALTKALSAREGMRILGTAPGKGAMVTFASPSAHAHDLAQILDKYGVAVRAGQHCAEPLMRHLGVTSTCRASFGIYNTMADVEACVDALDKALMLLG